jgi:predicted AAA+ superfamily ATPase
LKLPDIKETVAFMKQSLEQLYGDFLERNLPTLTERIVDLEPIEGKALALIGMRRVGKTYLCYQAMQNLLGQGIPKENILYLNFEDDRLFEFELSDCQTILDVFYAQRPEKKSEHCYFFFDEIQNIAHWERFIRRLIDTENVSVYVTGSSAKLLSTEIATGLRGRALDREVFTFSFDEYLRSHEASININRIGSKTRLLLNHHAETYCRIGGFPEIQQMDKSRRQEILQSYVDAVVLRDVVERHRISNVEALKALVYHLLRNPSTKLSVNKFYLDLKSRGLRIAKDDLYAFLRHLTDAYLLYQVPLWTRSEKKRQVNPKKVYVIDNGILDAYSTNITADHGAFLENLVFLTLRRQGLEVGYYETKRGREIDFVFQRNEETVLVQVAWRMDTEATRDREFRALEEAAPELNATRCIVVTLDEEGFHENPPVEIIPLWKFLLNHSET